MPDRRPHTAAAGLVLAKVVTFTRVWTGSLPVLLLSSGTAQEDCWNRLYPPLALDS